ncbi:MAG: host attachment protein [Patescibacteria group bacterium]
MIIPEKSQHFVHPTLIVIGDFEHAKLYRAFEDTANEVATLKSPEPSRPPAQGSVSSGGDRFMNPSADMDEGADRAQFTRDIIHQIETLLKDGDVKHVNLVMPTEMCHRIKEKLPDDVKGSVTKTLEADLVQEPLVDILERLVETPASLQQI